MNITVIADDTLLHYSLDDLTNQNEQIVVVIFLEQDASCDRSYLPLMSTGSVYVLDHVITDYSHLVIQYPKVVIVKSSSNY